MDINLPHPIELTLIQRDPAHSSKDLQIPDISNHKFRPGFNIFSVDGVDFS